MFCLQIAMVMLMIMIMVIFVIKGTKLCVPVVALSARDDQKLSKRLRKGFRRLAYLTEYKTKSEKKNTTNEYRYFLKPNFAEVNILLILVYSNQYNDSKRFKT